MQTQHQLAPARVAEREGGILRHIQQTDRGIGRHLPSSQTSRHPSVELGQDLGSIFAGHHYTERLVWVNASSSAATRWSASAAEKHSGGRIFKVLPNFPAAPIKTRRSRSALMRVLAKAGAGVAPSSTNSTPR